MREMYARGYADNDTIACEATVGIEIKGGDDVDQVTRHARFFASCGLGWGGGDHAAVVKRIEELIELKYPGRAFFVETEEDGKGVQVYDPRGFIKERCECAARVSHLEAQFRLLFAHVAKDERD
jgi:hypothetical protein